MALTRDAAASWLRRWDAQQQLHTPHREERFDAILSTLAAFTGHSPRVLDLGCGPGSLSARVRRNAVHAEVVAIDADPVLLAIGRAALGDDARIRFVDADLRSGWLAALPQPLPYDAAVSTTALHWLGLAELVRFYRELATALRPGAVLLDGDRFDFDHDQQAIARGVDAARDERIDRTEGEEDWQAWWDAAAADPDLAQEMEERRTRHHDHPHDNEGHSYEFHRAALLAAGFAEVGTVWQRRVDRVLIAVR